MARLQAVAVARLQAVAVARPDRNLTAHAGPKRHVQAAQLYWHARSGSESCTSTSCVADEGERRARHNPTHANVELNITQRSLKTLVVMPCAPCCRLCAWGSDVTSLTPGSRWKPQVPWPTLLPRHLQPKHDALACSHQRRW